MFNRVCQNTTVRPPTRRHAHVHRENVQSKVEEKVQEPESRNKVVKGLLGVIEETGNECCYSFQSDIHASVSRPKLHVVETS